MCEVFAEATYVKHHKKKIAFIFSAMRHFADELRGIGYEVVYYPLDQAKPIVTFTQAVEKTLVAHNVNQIIVTEPGEHRVLCELQSWSDNFNLPVDIRADTRFLCDHAEFETWSAERKSLRMEYFYRDMRKKYSILMDGDQPVGGQWNFDSDNRKPPQPSFGCPTPTKILLMK